MLSECSDLYLFRINSQSTASAVHVLASDSRSCQAVWLWTIWPNRFGVCVCVVWVCELPVIFCLVFCTWIKSIHCMSTMNVYSIQKTVLSHIHVGTVLRYTDTQRTTSHVAYYEITVVGRNFCHCLGMANVRHTQFSFQDFHRNSHRIKSTHRWAPLRT